MNNLKTRKLIKKKIFKKSGDLSDLTRCNSFVYFTLLNIGRVVIHDKQINDFLGVGADVIFFHTEK